MPTSRTRPNLPPSTRIVTCGGSPLVGPSAARMHGEIVSLAQKRSPRALLIPTATYDDPSVYERFERLYGGRLGCDADVLYLLDHAPPVAEIRKQIERSDIIFVSGGNTLKLMRQWRRLGIDDMLRRAHRRGVVLAGSSAGAICWFENGHSDSMSFYHSEDWQYIRVTGLGLLPFTCCPHVLAENRLADFQEMIRVRGGIGIGIDNDCAIAWIGERFRLIAARRNAAAFRVFRRRGVVITQEITPSDALRPITELLR